MADHYRMKTAIMVITKVKNKENFNIQKYFEMQFTYSYMTYYSIRKFKANRTCISYPQLNCSINQKKKKRTKKNKK